MQHLFAGGFSNQFKNLMKPKIIYNIVEGCNYIIQDLKATDKLAQNLEQAAEAVEEAYSSRKREMQLTDELADHLKALLSDQNFIDAASAPDNPRIQDSWHDLAKKIDDYPDFGGSKWLPNTEEILNCRNRTVGVDKNCHFKVNNCIYKIIDVGGQQNNREKYMTKLFDDIDVVLFVNSLSEYNLSLFEDERESRFKDSLHFWNNVIQSDMFKNCYIILFFNKQDIFVKKYYEKGIELPTSNKEFRAPPKREEEVDSSCQKALTWYEDMYKSLLTPAQRTKCAIHQTIATNPKVMEEVFLVVSKFLVETLLKNNGLAG